MPFVCGEMRSEHNRHRRCPRGVEAGLRCDHQRQAAAEAYKTFEKKWDKLCPPVVTSLHEAGEELLTFFDFPEAMWKSLRTTDPLGNLSREFRRRTHYRVS